MAEQYESLGEKTKLVDISLRYTAGDIEKAKAMASGQLQDITVIKAKFINGTKDESGLFLAFFNNIEDYISNITSATVTNGTLFEKIRIFEDWKSLYNQLKNISDEEESAELSEFNDRLMSLFIEQDIFPHVNEKDIDRITVLVSEALNAILGPPKIQCQVEIGATSSLALDLAGIEIETPGTAHDDTDSSLKVPVEAAVEDERVAKIENEADYVVEGKAIVAPVKGKYINDISVGEKIKVLLTGNDVISEKVLNALNAFDESGGRYPVTGRVKAKIPMDKSGYIVYTLVAKGILAKIIEEENVKILIDKPVEEGVEVAKVDNKLLFILAFVVGLIIVSGIILLSIL